MDSVLIDRWLGDGPRTAVHDEASVAVIRDAARAEGRARGFDEVCCGRLALVVSELGMNHLRHARDGFVAFRDATRDGVPGVEVIAADRGAGIRNALDALDGGARGGGSLGAGLSGVQRLAQEVDFDVRLDVGTCVRARIFARDVRRRREVAVLGRNYPGERSSGDDAWFGRTADALVLGLADGVGHGPEAREPARRAIDVLHASPDAAPGRVLGAIDSALRGTRGAVMAVVHVDEALGTIRHACAGNVTTSVRGAQGRSFSGEQRILGAPSRRGADPMEELVPLSPRDVVVLYSDGLRSRLDLDGARQHASRHPLALAQFLLDGFGRNNDDATVIVAR